MRIAFATETWAPSVDGIVTRLRATLRELVRQGHDLLLIAPAGAGVHEHPDGVQVVEIPSVGSRFVSGGRLLGLPLRGRVQRALRDFRPDIVHVLSPYILGRAAVTAAKALRLPLVTSFHQDLAAVAGHAGLGLLSPSIWWYLRHQHQQGQRTVVTSRAMIDLMHRQGIDRVDVWPFGVDLERFNPSRRTAEARELLAGPHTDEVIALYVGRLAVEKGLHRLYPLAQTPGVRLVMVGDGPMRDELERDLTPHSVRFTGWLSGDTLADAYAAADVFTFPSSTETLGFVLIEALASGLPVLAAASEPTAEILGGTAGGQMLTADEWSQAGRRVDQLIGAGRRSAASAAARSRSLTWDWAVATDALLQIYASVVRLDPAGRYASGRAS